MPRRPCTHSDTGGTGTSDSWYSRQSTVQLKESPRGISFQDLVFPSPRHFPVAHARTTSGTRHSFFSDGHTRGGESSACMCLFITRQGESAAGVFPPSTAFSFPLISFFHNTYPSLYLLFVAEVALLVVPRVASLLTTLTCVSSAALPHPITLHTHTRNQTRTHPHAR